MSGQILNRARRCASHRQGTERVPETMHAVRPYLSPPRCTLDVMFDAISRHPRSICLTQHPLCRQIPVLSKRRRQSNSKRYVSERPPLGVVTWPFQSDRCTQS